MAAKALPAVDVQHLQVIVVAAKSAAVAADVAPVLVVAAAQLLLTAELVADVELRPSLVR